MTYTNAIITLVAVALILTVITVATGFYLLGIVGYIAARTAHLLYKDGVKAGEIR